MSGDKLYSLFKTIARRALPDEDQADLIYGYVKSEKPLRIEIENKYTLEEDQLYLSPLCYRKTIRLVIGGHTHSIPTGSAGAGGAVDQVVELWGDLKQGDKVVLLRHGKGQSFYVLQKAGELT